MPTITADKSLLAAKKLLLNRGFDLLDVEGDWFDFAALQNNTYVFVGVGQTYQSKDFKKPTLTREQFEEGISKFFLEHTDIVDVSVRYDFVSYNVLSPDRAVMCHTVNVFGKDN